jgi:hypothetical protein
MSRLIYHPTSSSCCCCFYQFINFLHKEDGDKSLWTTHISQRIRDNIHCNAFMFSIYGYISTKWAILSWTVLTKTSLRRRWYKVVYLADPKMSLVRHSEFPSPISPCEYQNVIITHGTKIISTSTKRVKIK